MVNNSPDRVTGNGGFRIPQRDPLRRECSPGGGYSLAMRLAGRSRTARSLTGSRRICDFTGLAGASTYVRCRHTRAELNHAHGVAAWRDVEAQAL